MINRLLRRPLEVAIQGGLLLPLPLFLFFFSFVFFSFLTLNTTLSRGLYEL